MQNILSLSIISIQNAQAGKPNALRAMLWKGRLSAVPLEQVGELKSWASSHQNFFKALEELQRYAWAFTDETGLQVEGINTGLKLPCLCWPVDEKITWRYSQRPPHGMYEIDQILKDSEQQGLALAPILESLGGAKGFTRWMAHLYLLLSEIPLTEIKKRAPYFLCVKHPNIFAAARELKAGAEQRETERHVVLSGIHNDYPCWPKEL